MTSKPKTSSPKASLPDRGSLLAWVERVSAFWTEQSGLPPITGRIVGWLMICDPPEQSAAEIAEAIGASRASLTSSLRLLSAIGLIRSFRMSGARTAVYQIDDGAWESTLRRRIASLAAFRRITQDGLTLLGTETSRSARIAAADRVYAWAESIFEKTLGSLPQQSAEAAGRPTKGRRKR